MPRALYPQPGFAAVSRNAKNCRRIASLALVLLVSDCSQRGVAAPQDCKMGYPANKFPAVLGPAHRQPIAPAGIEQAKRGFEIVAWRQ
jgi:hypothetical protein